MVELEQDDFEKVLPLYQAGAECFPLILAVIRQKQRGWVFVDNRDDPVSAMVITKFGFMQIFGVEYAQQFDADIADFFAKQSADLPSYLLCYSPPPRWQRRMNMLVPDRVRRRERMRFVFHEASADYLGNSIEGPSGFELTILDENLIQKTDHFKLDIGSRFWASAEDFLANGLGVCLMKDGQIAAVCYSACIVDGLAEIDIVTREEYRGRGLAATTARYFIQECMRRGITPTWDCFVSNIASMKLAQKLGFTRSNSYFFYSFKEPLNFAESYNPHEP